jgi:hypothetical protein
MSFKFDHGDAVRVVGTAPLQLQPGLAGSVRGMRELEGERIYIVEYSDGESTEIPENLLERRRLACLCCGHPTRTEKTSGAFEICPVCFWEDDSVQSADPGYAGGANAVSLLEARRNFREFGASERQDLEHVRPPRPDEVPSGAWSDNEVGLLPAVDRALALRHDGKLDEAFGLCDDLLTRLGPDDRRLRTLLQLQLGHISWLRDDTERAAAHFDAAVGSAPRSELASLGLFHMLVDQGLWREALEEAVRFLKVARRASAGYRMIFQADDWPADLRPLAEQARALIEGR